MTGAGAVLGVHQDYLLIFRWPRSPCLVATQATTSRLITELNMLTESNLTQVNVALRARNIIDIFLKFATI